jgi:hypothetical protein
VCERVRESGRRKGETMGSELSMFLQPNERTCIDLIINLFYSLKLKSSRVFPVFSGALLETSAGSDGVCVANGFVQFSNGDM